MEEKHEAQYSENWGRFLLLLLFSIILANSPIDAKTLYVSPTGSNLTGNGSTEKPWKTITHATGKMGAGDVLVLKDGIYENRHQENMISPPSGKPGNYTVVKAEHDWKAIIDGQGFLLYSSYPVNLRDKAYIQIEGLKILNGTSEVAIEIANSSNIKILRTSIRNGVAYDAAFGFAISIGGSSHHVLVEDTWITGAMRYAVILYPGSGVGVHKIILRRVVVRWDYVKAQQPKASFAVYGATEPVKDPLLAQILCENCVAIDTNPGDDYYTQYGGFITRGFTQNNRYYGCLVLNIKASGGDSLSAGFELSSNDSNSSKGDKVLNSIVWDTAGPAIVFSGGDPNGTTLVDQSTIGHSAGAGIVNWGNTQFVVKNSLFLKNVHPNSNIKKSSYNWFNPGDQAEGTHALTEPIHLKYLVRTPGNGTGEEGAARGATIEKRYGVSGTLWDEPGYDQLTNEPLWPWPFEEQIKRDFSEPNDPPEGAYPSKNNTKRGFCADGKSIYGGPITLTSYIWEYLGSPCPTDICPLPLEHPQKTMGRKGNPADPVFGFAKF